MKICGFVKTVVFVIHTLVVFVMIGVANSTFTVIRSTKKNGQPDVDRFSNPSCKPLYCHRVFGSGSCAKPGCCYCQCNHSRLNYVMFSGRCVASDEIDEDCEMASEVPLSVADITKSGKVDFRSSCINALHVKEWSYRLNGPHWIQGSSNIFRVKSLVGNAHRWTLLWDKALNSKYSGLILRFKLTCLNANAGCFLIKSKGNYTIPGSGSFPSSSSTLPLSPSDVVVDATGGKLKPTVSSGTASRTNEKESNEPQPPAKTKRELEKKQTGIVLAGVMVSIAAGFVLVFATLLLMKKQRDAKPTKGKTRPGAPNVPYEEPIDSSAPTAQPTSDVPEFHNAFYTSDCVLSLHGYSSAARSSKLGPLPPVPPQEEESIYEEPMIIRNAGYRGLEKEHKEDEESAGNMSAKEQEKPPLYNVLEQPSSDENDYDDTVPDRSSSEV